MSDDFVVKEGRGSFFKNTQKKSENSPDYSGTVNVAGVMHHLAGWKETSKNGLEYLSISIKPQDGNPRLVQAPVGGSEPDSDF
jgi:uncharacterized protein (DUF736 family)